MTRPRAAPRGRTVSLPRLRIPGSFPPASPWSQESADDFGLRIPSSGRLSETLRSRTATRFRGTIAISVAAVPYLCLPVAGRKVPGVHMLIAFARSRTLSVLPSPGTMTQATARSG